MASNFSWVNVARAVYIFEGKVSVSCGAETIPGRIYFLLSKIKSIKGNVDKPEIKISAYLRSNEDVNYLCNSNEKRYLIFAYTDSDENEIFYIPDMLKENFIFSSKDAKRKIDSILIDNDYYADLALEFLASFQPDKKIKILIKNLDNKSKQELAVNDLIGLEDSHIDSLVYELNKNNDVFKLDSFRIRNSNDNFESYAIYRPNLKSDAIDVILNRITGISFISLANGETISNSNITKRGWLSYLGRLKEKNN